MQSYMGLYYPFIHVRDESWLKLTSLYWNRMGRIVPEGYRLRDSATVREFKDCDYVRDYRPGRAPVELVDDFLALLATRGRDLADRYGLHLSPSWPDDPSTAAAHPPGVGNPKLAYVFGPKMPASLVEGLVDLGLAERDRLGDPQWVGMHPRLAAVYMTALAGVMAARRGVEPVSDDALSHVGIGDLSLAGLGEALLTDHADTPAASPGTAAHLMAGLTIRLVAPVGLDDVPTARLVEFRTRYAQERAEFQAAIRSVVDCLDIDGIRDPDALRDHLQVQYETRLRPQLDDLERRLKAARMTTATALVSIKTNLPAGLAATGLALLHAPGAVVGTAAVALGVWELARGQHRHRRDLLDERAAVSYLYRLGTDLAPKDLAAQVHRIGRRFALAGAR
jgi:hypothetical protein